MDASDLKWLIGVSLGFLTTVGMIALGAYRAVVARMDRIFDSLKQEDKTLHERVNRVRDEYVRRVDLDDHMSRLDKRLDEISTDVKSILRKRD